VDNTINTKKVNKIIRCKFLLKIGEKISPELDKKTTNPTKTNPYRPSQNFHFNNILHFVYLLDFCIL